MKATTILCALITLPMLSACAYKELKAPCNATAASGPVHVAAIDGGCGERRPLNVARAQR